MLSELPSDSAPRRADLSNLCLAITEHAPLPMATVEGATHIVRYVNPAFCQMMNKPLEQLVGRQLYELLPEKDECVRLLDRVFLNGKPESFTEREDCKPHPIFWSYTMWPVEADEHLVGIMIQVTETAEARGLTVAMNEALLLGSVRQHELTEAAENLNSQLQLEIGARRESARELAKQAQQLAEKARLIDLSNDAIIVHEFHNKISLWNTGAEKLYGWTFKEVIGKHVHDLLSTEFPKPMAEITAQLKSEGHFSGEVVQVARDGRRVSSLCRWALDPNSGSVLTSYTDISERKHLEQEREALLVNEQSLRMESEAANRAKDIFLATLSHEMRTPLNAIMGWASIIRRDDCTREDIQEGILVIERNVRAQAQLIDDILDVSRIVSGKLKLEIVACELSALVHESIDVIRPTADAKEIGIQVDLDPEASHVSCDPHRIRQVIWNILANSVKFTKKGGTISVKLSRYRSMARVEISDDGQGIARDLLPYIFDRFRQGEGGSKRQFGGLGLGLSLVKNLVELHQGDVFARSDGPGRGSVFTVHLPLRAVRLDLSATDSRASVAPPSPAKPMRLDGLRILMVDDEVDARKLLAKVLMDVGAVVTTAGSVVEALQIMETAQPEVLISDIAMPQQDGYDLIRLVRKSGRHAGILPAIALTAFVHKDDIRQALLAGFQVHVPKPIDPYDLITIVGSVAGRSGIQA